MPYRRKVVSTNRHTQAGYRKVYVLQPLAKHLLPTIEMDEV